MGDGIVNLPPGFRFCPTDEDLILHFLYPKVLLFPCHPNIIPDLDCYPLDPWELEGKALSSGNQWYFFSQMMENRVTETGYWKQVEFEEPIFTSAGKKVGIKKQLAFFIGDNPAGIETNWMMQEYHLCNYGLSGTCSKIRGSRKLDYIKWVLCLVHESKGNDDDNGTELSFLDEMFLSLDDDLDDISPPN